MGMRTPDSWSLTPTATRLTHAPRMHGTTSTGSVQTDGVKVPPMSSSIASQMRFPALSSYQALKSTRNTLTTLGLLHLVVSAQSRSTLLPVLQESFSTTLPTLASTWKAYRSAMLSLSNLESLRSRSSTELRPDH